MVADVRVFVRQLERSVEADEVDVSASSADHDVLLSCSETGLLKTSDWMWKQGFCRDELGPPKTAKGNCFSALVFSTEPDSRLTSQWTTVPFKLPEAKVNDCAAGSVFPRLRQMTGKEGVASTLRLTRRCS